MNFKPFIIIMLLIIMAVLPAAASDPGHLPLAAGICVDKAQGLFQKGLAQSCQMLL